MSAKLHSVEGANSRPGQDAVGADVLGASEGELEGDEVGDVLGETVGENLKGVLVLAVVVVRRSIGEALGCRKVNDVGTCEGRAVGKLVGEVDGACEGLAVGACEGLAVGDDVVGDIDGDDEGA